MADAKVIFGAVGGLLGVLGLGYAVGTAVTKQAMGTSSLNTQIEKLGERVESVERDYEKLPIGTILPWDPVRRDANGKLLQRAPLPRGWQLCDGTKGTPNLVNRFIRGASSVDAAGEIGGTSKIPEDPGHTHGATGRPVEDGYHGTRGDRAPYNGEGDKLSEHHHGTSEAGAHDHGGNNIPPYFDLVFIMKVTAG